jgi:hypothetical protein
MMTTTTTRREAFMLLAAACIAAMNVRPALAETTTTGAAEPFNWHEYEMVIFATMVTAGMTPDTAGNEEMMVHLMFGDPLPADCEWARTQCREVLRVVSARLEAN